MSPKDRERKGARPFNARLRRSCGSGDLGTVKEGSRTQYAGQRRRKRISCLGGARPEIQMVLEKAPGWNDGFQMVPTGRGDSKVTVRN